MKMAIVHDAFLHVGGAEKVFLELVKLFPEADLFVPIINFNLISEIKKNTAGQLQTTWFSRFSFFYLRASWLKPFLVWYWENLNLGHYDLVISSSHSFNSKLINVAPGAIHLAYVYTPPRYLSSQFNEMQFLRRPLIKKIARPLLNWLEKKDLISGQKPTIMIADSKTVQTRIKNRYGRSSLLVYPPVEIGPLIKSRAPRHYLCFSRLVKQKGIDLAVKTCTKLHLPLVVVGTGPELNRLKKMAGPTITFTGFVPDQDLEKIFRQTKALINCAIEEDFGMVTVEVAARGIPVIGYHSGGLTETIVEHQTGIFFRQRTVKSLSRALRQFEQLKFDPQICHNFARQFSVEMFRKKMQTVVNFYQPKHQTSA